VILTRSPLRISLAGGGTDIQDYYEKFGGEVVSFAINQYVYVTLNKGFLEGIRFAYSKTETVESAKFLKHRIGRAVLSDYLHDSRLEITTVADVPSRGTGLASSSAFTAALIQALSEHLGIKVPKNLLAEKVCNIEINRLNSPIGKQDQYASVYGGINSISFLRNGKVQVKPIKLSRYNLSKFENSIFLAHTGLSRSTDAVFRNMGKSNLKKIDEYYDNLHTIKSYTQDMLESLKNMDLKNIGKILNESWAMKIKINREATNPIIDDIYQRAIKLGAYGGKLLGAGSGGFLFFVCDPDQKSTIVQKLGCRHIFPQIDFHGTSVIYKGGVGSV
jgi:D-glycero-alpha-D-manno-heptose-7-phosphate kinase